MGEDALIQLSEKFLETDKGKSLLGESINIADITNRIQDLSSQYNINLSTIAETSIEDINSTLGSSLTREQRKEKRRQRKLSARERLQEKLDEVNITKVNAEQKIRAEIALLKQKLKSQIPALQEFTINGRLKDQNKMRFDQVSLAKRNHCKMARDVARTCREILGGNGLMEDYSPMRHMTNIETVFTYEGTHEMHSLILGQSVTGISAYDS